MLKSYCSLPHTFFFQEIFFLLTSQIFTIIPHFQCIKLTLEIYVIRFCFTVFLKEKMTNNLLKEMKHRDESTKEGNLYSLGLSLGLSVLFAGFFVFLLVGCRICFTVSLTECHLSFVGIYLLTANALLVTQHLDW